MPPLKAGQRRLFQEAADSHSKARRLLSSLVGRSSGRSSGVLAKIDRLELMKAPSLRWAKIRSAPARNTRPRRLVKARWQEATIARRNSRLALRDWPNGQVETARRRAAGRPRQMKWRPNANSPFHFSRSSRALRVGGIDEASAHQLASRMWTGERAQRGRVDLLSCCQRLACNKTAAGERWNREMEKNNAHWPSGGDGGNTFARWQSGAPNH